MYEKENLPDEEVETEVKWSDDPSSEFKNQLMRYLIEKLSECDNKPFSWKFSATSHGKGVIDGVGGKVKSSVQLGATPSYEQDSETFAKIDNKLFTPK